MKMKQEREEERGYKKADEVTVGKLVKIRDGENMKH